MSKERNRADPFHRERRKIRESGVLDALIDYVEGKRDLSSSQVSAALGLLRKSISDLSAFAPSGTVEREKNEIFTADVIPIEIHVVDAQR